MLEKWQEWKQLLLEFEILRESFYGSTVLQWLLALLAIPLTFLVLRLVKSIVGRRLKGVASATETKWDDNILHAFDKTNSSFLLIVGIFLGSLVLQPPERVQFFVQSLFVVALLIQAGIWVSAILVSGLGQYRERVLTKNPGAVTTVNAIGFLSRIVIWSVVILLALDNMGIDVTALVAGLGIGGVAVALAVQNILGDLFASLSIVLDKPFVIGDFLIVDDFLGSVEHVGLKTTRVRSLSGEQLIFSNSDLLKSRLRNYGRMFERRVVFSIGVTYDTPREKIRRIPEIIREAVKAQDKVRFDRSHFAKFGDYALLFETVYYVLTADYTVYMDIQQAINLKLHEAFEKEGIEFAYPTQKLFVEASVTGPPQERVLPATSPSP